jgi:uncharacterized protein with HEPN domain
MRLLATSKSVWGSSSVWEPQHNLLDEDRTRISHMLDAAGEVIRFTSGRDRADFDSDRMLLFAVVRGIEIIREAATKASAETRDLSPEIPWAAIVTMRHRLAHGYSMWTLTSLNDAAPMCRPHKARLLVRAPLAASQIAWLPATVPVTVRFTGARRRP